MDDSLGKPISRRNALAGLGCLAVLVSCGHEPPARETQVPLERPSETYLEEATVSSLVASKVFHVAHRGSGDNWPEHTMAAYSGAVEAGAKAIEISVCATRDGVLVCHHDTNTLRMTGVDLEIADTDYGRITVLKNDARSWLGPGAGLEPIPRLKDVLDRFAATHVIFIEDKQGTNTETLLDVMDAYPDATEHFVWKQTAGSPTYEQAAARGYTTWGYFIDNTDGQFTELAPRFDLLGIYHGATDAEIEELVSFGKPVICWEIHTRWMRDRVLALGVQGLMCSNYLYVSNDTAAANRDAFGSGVRSPGDLPWVLSPKFQPQLLPSENALRMVQDSTVGYILGSLGPLPSGDQEIRCDLRWPESPPGRHAGAGVAFGMSDDQPYRAGIPGPVGGYHVLLRASGAVELYRRSPMTDENSPPGELIGSFPSEPVGQGVWATIRIVMKSQELTVTRDGDPAWSVSVTDTSYRSGYLGLLKSYPEPVPVDFRSVTAGRVGT